MTHVEVIELISVTHYTKRKRDIPNIEICFNLVEFDIADGTLERCRINLLEYLQILDEKDDHLKKQYNFKRIKCEPLLGFYSMVDRLNDMGGQKLSQAIMSSLGVVPTQDSHFLIRQLMKISEEEPLPAGFGNSITAVVINPYLKKTSND
ncbi:MAG: hypothetical protein Q8N88_05805 [Nanoarchaeota archaeon]|nr:hypothetical protein [Nanoarchaeota archaeon]